MDEHPRPKQTPSQSTGIEASLDASTSRHQPMTSQQATDLAGRALASWGLRPVLAWIVAFAVSLGGLILTAVGAAMGQVRGLDEASSVYLLAGFVAASAIVGALLMVVTRRPVSTWGFRRPANARVVWWGLPLLALPVVVLVTTPPAVAPTMLLPYALLTIAVGFNEEIWFRGLAQAALRRFGHRVAIVGAAGFFGLLHLANVLNGKSALYLVLQLVLAVLVGFVLAEIVAITGSLWIGICWHFAYDFSAYVGGDALTPLGLVGVGVMYAILVVVGVRLWRRLPS